jgi:hypothetical protein
MHPFFYGDFASQHRDQLVAAAHHHRLRRPFRRRPVTGITVITSLSTTQTVARSSSTGAIDAAA